MTIEKKFVSPELAMKWLEGPVKNRKLSDLNIRKYAKAMKLGEWQYNPADAVCFDNTGRLINAQHRLWAVVESGIGQWFLVVTDVDPVAQDVMDQGYRRTVAHQLDIDSVPHPRETAAIARMSVLWHGGRVRGNSVEKTVSTTEVREWVEKSDEVALTKAIDATMKIRRQYQFSTGPLGAVLYDGFVLSNIDAAEFAHKLETGQDKLTSSIYHLTKYMQRQAKNNRTLQPYHQLYLIINCWNNWRDDKPVSKIMSPTSFTANTKYDKLR